MDAEEFNSIFLAEEFNKQNDEIRRLKNENKSLRTQIRFSEYGAYILGFVVALVVLTFIGYPLYKTTTASDEIKFCYILTDSRTNSAGIVYLKGSIDWGRDVTIGSFCSTDQALQLAKELECNIKGNR